LAEQGKPADFLGIWIGIWIGITPERPGQLFAMLGAVLRYRERAWATWRWRTTHHRRQASSSWFSVSAIDY
jgi:hypothetical protein